MFADALERPMTETLQIPNLAHCIAEYIRSEGLPPGTRLPGRKLAERFRVSRTPVERALRLLEQHQVVSPSASGGYEVQSGPVAISPEVLGAEPQSEYERLYLRLADDHTEGRLPERASENELIRRYGSSRGMIMRVLQRAAGEGWTERLPGRGWAFIPLLTSELTYEQICRYRIVVEPAAMLEPTFVLDRPALEACRREQVAMFRRRGARPFPCGAVREWKQVSSNSAGLLQESILYQRIDPSQSRTAAHRIPQDHG